MTSNRATYVHTAIARAANARTTANARTATARSTTARSAEIVDAVEMPTGLADPEMRIYAAFVGLVAVVITSLFSLPGIG